MVRVAELVEALDRQPRRARLDPEVRQEGVGEELLAAARRHGGRDLVGVGVQFREQHLVDEGDLDPLAGLCPQHEGAGFAMRPLSAAVSLGQLDVVVHPHEFQPPRVGEGEILVPVLAPARRDHELLVGLRRPGGPGRTGSAGPGRGGNVACAAALGTPARINPQQPSHRSSIAWNDHR